MKAGTRPAIRPAVSQAQRPAIYSATPANAVTLGGKVVTLGGKTITLTPRPS